MLPASPPTSKRQHEVMQDSDTNSATTLVTGGAGFIGSEFVRSWLRLGNGPVVTLDKLSYSGHLVNLQSVADHPSHTFVRGDICDQDLTARLMRDHSVMRVVHMAAESHVDRSIRHPDPFIETNIEGTYRLLTSACDYWNQLPEPHKKDFRFLHVSTDEVFGTLAPDDAPFHEGSTYAPNSPYSASKAASDHLVRAWHHTYGLPTLITHCSNNYGPHHLPEKLIPLAIMRALQGQPIPVYGDGQQVRDWLYVEDHCNALRTMLALARPGTTYNIGGNSELTNLTVIHNLCDQLDVIQPRSDGKSYRAQITFVTDRPGHDRRYAIDATRIRRDLGWRPEEDFDSGLRKTIAWYLRNAKWLSEVTGGAFQDWIRQQYEVRA